MLFELKWTLSKNHFLNFDFHIGRIMVDVIRFHFIVKSSTYCYHYLVNVIKTIVHLILMPVSLTDQPGVVPSLDRTSSELETTHPVSNPVPRTFQLLVVGSLTELEPGRVDGVDISQRVAEFVDLGSRPSTS